MNSSLTKKRHADQVLSCMAEGARANTIAASWRRCLDVHKLDPQHDAAIRVLTTVELRQALAPLDQFLIIAEDFLVDLYRQVSPADYIVMLTDANGITLGTKVSGDVGAFGRWGLCTGAVWSEEVEGTNGVGVCLSERRPVTVHRNEHFRSDHISLTCSVAPIFDPSGQLIGGLDISSGNVKIDEQLIAFTQAATNRTAARIEAEYFRNIYRDCWIVSLAESSEGLALIAFSKDRELVAANRWARQWLGIDEASLKRGIEVVEDGFRDFPVGRPPALLIDGNAAFLSLGRSSKFEFPRERWRSCGAGEGQYVDLVALTGGDAKLMAAFRRIRASARIGIPVMIFGETGTGKELFARTIHDAVSSPVEAFLRIDCCVSPETELDRLLFSPQRALTEQIDCISSNWRGGTLFLDKVGALPLNIQSRLISVLESNGSENGLWTQQSRSPLRIISTTQMDLEECIKNGSFRADLYYLLTGSRLALPPLRDRQDKDRLISQLLNAIDPCITISNEARVQLKSFNWPGNIRQLIQLLRVASASCVNNRIESEDIDLTEEPIEALSDRAPSSEEACLETAEKAVILRQLEKYNFDVVKAASVLKMSRATLYRKIKRFNL